MIDRQAAQAYIDATVPLGFTGDETLDVGMDTGHQVPTYTGTFLFTGTIRGVKFELK